jgi:hypothetical protein
MDQTLAAGTYKCTCSYMRWFGDNCESSEDDCQLDSGTQICTNEGDTCVDCARYAKNGVPNPECAQGYTCEGAAGPGEEDARFPSRPRSWANFSLL